MKIHKFSWIPSKIFWREFGQIEMKINDKQPFNNVSHVLRMIGLQIF